MQQISSEINSIRVPFELASVAQTDACLTGDLALGLATCFCGD